MMRYVDRDKHYRVSSELYAGLINLLLTLPLEFKKTAAVEIGSYIGESANILSLFFQEVICIDFQLILDLDFPTFEGRVLAVCKGC